MKKKKKVVRKVHSKVRSKVGTQPSSPFLSVGLRGLATLLVIFGILFSLQLYSSESSLLKEGWTSLSQGFNGMGNLLTGAAVGVEEMQVQAGDCAGAYTGGNWTINSSVSCSNDVISVDGFVIIRNDSISPELVVNNFSLTTTGVYDLRGNSTNIVLAVPDLDSSTPSAYTNDWDANSGREFRIAMNESQNRIMVYVNNTDNSSFLYEFDLDDNPSTGGIVGAGDDFGIGYIGDFGGPLIGCYNSSDPQNNLILLSCDNSPLTCGNVDGYDGTFMGNFTVYCNNSGNAYEVVIDLTNASDGIWETKPVYALDPTDQSSPFYYTTFRNNSVLDSGINASGNLVLNNVTLNLENNFTISGGNLDIQKSNLTFRLTSNGSANFMISSGTAFANINHSAFTSNNSILRWKARITDGDYNLTNNVFSYVGYDNGDGIGYNYEVGFYFASPLGGLVYNNTFSNCGTIAEASCVSLVDGDGNSRNTGLNFSSNTIFSESAGLGTFYLSDYSNTSYTSGVFIGNNTFYGRFSVGGRNHIISGNYINKSLWLSSVEYNNTFINNEVRTELGFASINEQNTSYGSSIIIYSNGYGKMTWSGKDNIQMGLVSVDETFGLGNYFYVGNNLLGLNVGNGAGIDFSVLNTTASLEFYSLLWNNSVQLCVNNSGTLSGCVDCNSGNNCTYSNITGIMLANVTHFSNYSTNGSISVAESPAVTYLTNFTDTFTGTTINASRYTITQSGLNVSQSDKIIFNGSYEGATFFTNSFVDTNQSFVISINVAKFDQTEYVGILEDIGPLGGAPDDNEVGISIENDTTRILMCKLLKNDTGYFIEANGFTHPAETMQVNYTEGQLFSLNYSNIDGRYSCNYAGEMVSNTNSSAAGADFITFDAEAISQMNLQLDDLNFYYGTLVEEAPGSSYCGGAYTGGNWNINSSISCSNEAITVNGTLTVADNSVSANDVTNNFTSNSAANYNLRDNSTNIVLAVPDLDSSTPSAYTNDWDSNSSHEFRIAMNETQNRLIIFTNNTNNLDFAYSLNLDEGLSGGVFGPEYGDDFLVGYSGGPAIGCYNSSLLDLNVLPCDSSPVTCGNVSGYDSNYDGNFTVYCNNSGNAYEIVIDLANTGNGLWKNKPVYALDLNTSAFYYTTFRNSSILPVVAVGNLTLNNVTLNLQNNLTLSGGYLNIYDSNVTMMLTANNSANMDIRSSNVNLSGTTFSANNTNFKYIIAIQNGSYANNDFSDLALWVYPGTGGVFSNNVVSNCGGTPACIMAAIGYSNGFNFTGNNITATSGTAWATMVAGNNYTFSNNNIYGSASLFYGNVSVSNNLFNRSLSSTKEYGIDMIIFTNNIIFPGINSQLMGDWNDTLPDTFIYSNNYGKITWNLSNYTTPEPNPSSFGLGYNLYLNNNIVGVNAQLSLINFNTTASIEFYGLPWNNSVQLCNNISGTLSGCVDCNSGNNCTYSNITGIMLANVTHFSNYSTNGSTGVAEVGVSYCSGAYTGGNWNVSSSINCSNEVIPVNGIITVQDLSETAVTQFGASTGGIYDLRNNSTGVFDTDLSSSTPSAYTTDWDSDSNRVFKIAMNESSDTIQVYGSLPNVTALYSFDLDNNAATGTSVGGSGSSGMDLTFGYHADAGGVLMACYNSSVPGMYLTWFAASGSIVCGQTMDVGYDRNYTITFNSTASGGGNTFEFIINSTGSWTDKRVELMDGGNAYYYYTKFKTSGAVAGGRGNLTLNNVTLTLSGNLTINGILNVNRSFLYFGSNNTLFTSNIGASILINNSNVTSNGSIRYGIRSLGSDFTLENSYLNDLGAVVSSMTYPLKMEGTGGMIKNLSLGANQKMYGVQIAGSGISVLNSTFSGSANTINLLAGSYNNIIRGNNLSTGISYLNGGSSYNNLIAENTIAGVGNILIGQTSPAHLPYNNTYLNNNIQQVITTYVVNYTNYFIYNNSYGQIKWTKNNFSSSFGGNAVLVLDQTVFVRSNLLGVTPNMYMGNFNTTAELTFRNLLWNNSVQLCENVSGTLSGCVDCNSSNSCTYSNITGIMLANVTHFSNYSTNGSISVAGGLINNISVVKYAVNSTVNCDSNVTSYALFIINVTNNNAYNLTNIIVNDTPLCTNGLSLQQSLPIYTNFSSCNYASWTIANLGPGETYNITLNFSVSSSGNLTNTVQVWNATSQLVNTTGNITVTGSCGGESPGSNFLSNFVDTFDGATINTSVYNVTTVGNISISQNNKLVINGSSGYSFAATNSYVNVSNNFSVSVKVSKFDNTTYGILAGDPYSNFGVFISSFSGSSISSNFVRCNIAMNSSGYFLNVPNPGNTVPVSYVENATLTLNYHANNYTCDCTYGGQTISCGNESLPSTDYSILLFGGLISVSNLQFDDLNLTYNPVAAAETPAGPGLTIYNNGFFENFTSLNSTFYNNTLMIFSNPSIINGQLMMNKTTFEGTGQDYFYTTVDNVSTNSSWNISVWINLTNTTTNAQGSYLIEAGILIYNRTTYSSSLACEVGYGNGIGLILANYNNTHSSAPTYTSVSRSYGNLTYSYNNATGIFNCSLDDGTSVAGSTGSFGPGMGMGVVSQLSQIGAVAPNGSVTAYFDNFNYTYAVAATPAVTYLSNFTDDFAGTTLNTSRYTLDVGGTLGIAQNETVIVNGTDTGADSFAGTYTNLGVNTSRSFYVSVGVLNLTNTSAITSPNGYADVSLSLTDVGLDFLNFAVCKVRVKPTGIYLEDDNVQSVPISATNGTLVLSFNASNLNYTCAFAGDSLTSANLSGLGGNNSLDLVAEALNTSVWAEIDNLEFAYGVYSAPVETPAVTYLSNFTDSFTGVTINTSRYILDEGGNLSMAQNGTLVVNGTDSGFDSWEGVYTNLGVNTSDSFYISVDVNLTNTSAITNASGATRAYISLADVATELDFAMCVIYISPAEVALQDGEGGGHAMPLSITNGTLVMAFNVSSMNYSCQFAGQNLTHANLSSPSGNYSLFLESDALYTSTWAEMDNLEFAYGVYSAPVAETPAVTYLSNFNDTFDGATINTSRYTVISDGNTTLSQNNKVIINGTSGRPMMGMNSAVNISNNFSVSVKVSKFDNTTYSIMGADPYSSFGLYIGNFSNSSYDKGFVRCKLAMNSSGYFLNHPNSGNTVPVSYVENGTLTLTYYANNYSNSCNYDGKNVSGINESSSSGVYSIIMNAQPLSLINLQFDDLNLTYNPVAATPASDNSPNVTLANPENNYVNDSASRINITFECDATDDYQLVNVSLYLTNPANASFALNQTTNVGGTSNSTSWLVELGNGNYTWGCLAFDNASQSSFSTLNHSILINHTVSISDTTYPTVTLISPASSSYTNANNSTLPFVFGYQDSNDATANCTLYLNGVARGNNASTRNNTNTNLYSSTTFSEGSNSWYVNCTDAAGNTNGTSTWTFIADTINPTASINSINTQYSGQWTNTQTLSINATASDVNINYWNLSVYNSNSLITSNQTSGSNLNNLVTLSVSADGNYTVNLTVTDQVNNSNTSTFNLLVDTFAPTVNLTTPPTNVLVSLASITSTFNFTDASSSSANCTLYVGGIVKATNSSVLNYTNTVLTGSSLSEGNNSWYVNCTDLASNTGISEVRVIRVDTTTPSVSGASVNVSRAKSSTLVGINVTVTDTNLAWVKANGINMSASGSDMYNLSATASTLGCSEGTCTITIIANDSARNANSSVTTSYVVDDTAPALFSNSTSIATGSVYNASSTYYFNVTWNETGTISSPLLEFNSANYTMTTVGSGVYYYTFTDLATSTYSYKFIAIDDSGNSNETASYTYVVAQATPSITALLNGTAANLSVAYPNTVNASGSTDAGTLAIYRNGTSVTNGAASLLTVGSYRYDFNVTGNQNYTNASATLYATVTKGTPVLTYYLNGNTTNLSVVYPNTVNATASTTAGTLTIYRNETNVTSENGAATSLAVGYYQYDFNISGGENYTDTSTTLYANVTIGTPTLSLYLNGAENNMSVNYGTKVNVTGTGSASQLSYTLYRNNVSTPNPEILSNLSYGTNYTYLFNTSGNANYSASSVSYQLEVLLGATQELTNSTDITVTNTTTEIVIQNSSLSQVRLNSSIASTTQVNLSLGLLMDQSTGTFSLGENNFTMTREVSGVNYTVDIPANTNLTGGSAWDGKFTLPTLPATSGFTAPSGSVNLVIEVGSTVEINLSAPAKIVLNGMSGKSAGWSRSGTITEITTVCDNATLPTNINTTSPRICSVDSGSDLIVWTYHFTNFAAYTPSDGSSSSSSSGGGSSSSSSTPSSAPTEYATENPAPKLPSVTKAPTVTAPVEVPVENPVTTVPETVPVEENKALAGMAISDQLRSILTDWSNLWIGLVVVALIVLSLYPVFKRVKNNRNREEMREELRQQAAKKIKQK